MKTKHAYTHKTACETPGVDVVCIHTKLFRNYHDICKTSKQGARLTAIRNIDNLCARKCYTYAFVLNKKQNVTSGDNEALSGPNLNDA